MLRVRDPTDSSLHIYRARSSKAQQTASTLEMPTSLSLSLSPAEELPSPIY